MEIIKVSSTSVPNHVAGAIASLMREQDKLMIQTIGAAALNQAIKSIAIARGYIIPTGKELICIPSFHDCKLLMQTGQVQKIIDFFDGYSDDKVSCKYIKKVGIKAEFECETELSPEEAAGHCKGVFKGTPEGKVLYFSIQPDGFFG